jgi:hypothetical protein
MAEYSRLARGRFVASSASQVVNLPFVPNAVKVWNYTNYAAAIVDNNVVRAFWDSRLVVAGRNPTMIDLYNATAQVTDVITINGISSFQAGLSLQYGPVVQHTANTDFNISKAATAVVTVAGAGILDHGLQTGDVVVFSNLAQTSTTGMNQIAGIPFMITRTAATTFTINWDTSGANYTAFNTSTSTNNVGSYKKVLYPDLYLPGDSIISRVTVGATTTIQTTAQHQLQVGQEVAFRIPSVWGPIELNSLPNVVIPGSPIYGYVVSVTNLQTVVVNINSTGYTAFNPNQPFASVGRSFAQLVPVGDVNSGGVQISAGSVLYPSPQYSYATQNDSIVNNGPAIIGSYVNNTRQGFVIGSGVAVTKNTAHIMSANDVIVWEAILSDYNS